MLACDISARQILILIMYWLMLILGCVQFFLSYLHTGVFQESYVWELYQQRCWDFFPVGECFRKLYEDELAASWDQANPADDCVNCVQNANTLYIFHARITCGVSAIIFHLPNLCISLLWFYWSNLDNAVFLLVCLQRPLTWQTFFCTVSTNVKLEKLYLLKLFAEGFETMTHHFISCM
jgi:hypothetical protein